MGGATPFRRLPLRQFWPVVVGALVVAALLIAAIGCAARAGSAAQAGTPAASSPSPSPSESGSGASGGATSAYQPSASAGGYQPSADVGPTDLSLCKLPRVTLPEKAGAPDLREFARKLHGTWELNTRTIHGLTIPTHSYFYFDLDIEHATATRITGTAMMLDKGNLGVLDTRSVTQECPKDAKLGAFWTVTIEPVERGRRLAIAMDGEYIGSYAEFAKGTRATESMAFIKKDDAYLAGGLTTPNGGMGEDVWDRVSLMGDVLTYLSCKEGYIERYVRRSVERPLLDSLTLRQVWERKKRTGELRDPHFGGRGGS